jgi:hypothetical protein
MAVLNIKNLPDALYKKRETPTSLGRAGGDSSLE